MVHGVPATPEPPACTPMQVQPQPAPQHAAPAAAAPSAATAAPCATFKPVLQFVEVRNGVIVPCSWSRDPSPLAGGSQVPGSASCSLNNSCVSGSAAATTHAVLGDASTLLGGGSPTKASTAAAALAAAGDAETKPTHAAAKSAVASRPQQVRPCETLLPLQCARACMRARSLMHALSAFWRPSSLTPAALCFSHPAPVRAAFEQAS